MSRQRLEQRVLALLRGSEEGYLSGEAMSRQLGVSRAAVWKAVQRLEEDGLTIQRRTNQGYRLVESGGGLTESAIRARLAPGDSRTLVVAEELGSTSDRLKELAAAGAEHGTAVAALRQTQGHGRRGRSFFSPPGGLYLSVLLRPEAEIRQLMSLTALTAVAVRRAVEEESGLAPEIKWTNDLVAGGRKLCGISTELSVEAETGRVAYAVIGIGINAAVAAFPPELRDMATSLQLETGRPPELSRLAAAVLRQTDRIWPQGLGPERTEWLREYRDHCLTLGKEVLLVRGEQRRRAVALDLTEDAALVVRYEDGSQGIIDSGEVSVRGLYGYVDP